ncbi:MAG: Lrp/AsnC family transcriptional regulator [Candidatus Schekmanbacteria bacterium]|nr:Lrp/AsnC family transcriptional regulator [Candidatus Schekmanbacteria bacterium]
MSDQNKIQKIVRELQADLPLTSYPFKEIAQRCDMTEDELLEAIKNLQEKGIIRRFGAVVRHQRMGITANGMGVWIVPPEDAGRVGKIMATFREVSHCYQRPTFPDWPYNLFTMIHSSTVAECEDVAARISEATGIKDYKLLFSSREFKKVSMVYF